MIAEEGYRGSVIGEKRFSFDVDKNSLTVVEVSTRCSNMCIQNFVCLFKLTFSNNGEGLAVGRQLSIQTTFYCLYCSP